MAIPRIVDTVINEYITLFNEHLSETIEGLYIHGSIALNAYVEDSSDIDFITITNRPLAEEDSSALSYIHSTIAKKYKKPELDGVYIHWRDIRENFILTAVILTVVIYFITMKNYVTVITLILTL